MALGLAACEDAQEQVRRTREERMRLAREDSAAYKIAVTPTEDCLPLVVAKHLHLYDSLRVDLRLRKYGAISECRHMLMAGKVQAAVIDTVLMSELLTDRQPLVRLAGADKMWQLITAKKARLTRVEQLENHLVAADGHGASREMAEQVVDSLVKKGKMVFVVQVEDVNTRLEMLNAGSVDAAMMPEPQATMAVKAGGRRLNHKRSKEKNGAVVALKSTADDASRKAQWKHVEAAMSVASDSIKRYGKDRYMSLLKW